MNQSKVSIPVQQDQDHGLQDGGHHGSQGRRRPLLTGWLVLAAPLKISPLLLTPLPLNIWEEDQGLYK